LLPCSVTKSWTRLESTRVHPLPHLSSPLGFELTRWREQSLVLSTENTDHYFLVYDRKKVRYSLPAQYARLVGPALEEYHASQQTVSAVHEGTAAPSAGLRVGATAPRQDGNPPPPYREGNESHMN